MFSIPAVFPKVLNQDRIDGVAAVAVKPWSFHSHLCAGISVSRLRLVFVQFKEMESIL